MKVLFCTTVEGSKSGSILPSVSLPAPKAANAIMPLCSINNSNIPKPYFAGVHTNYKVYNKESKKNEALIIEPKTDFTEFYKEERCFPRLKAANADFTQSNLEATYLKGSDLEHSNFTKAFLYGAKLHYCNLSNCNFREVNAIKAKFYKSDLSGSSFIDADFTKANFQNAKFKNCDLKNADFKEANFINADLSSAFNLNKVGSLTFAVYSENTAFPVGFKPESKNMIKFEPGADLSGIYLAGTYIQYSNLLDFDDYKKINFENSNLEKTKFSHLDLRGCNFNFANCKKTDFDSCLLSNSSFSNCDLERASFENSSLDNARFHGERTNLKYANFVNADLSGTDIAELKEGQLANAIFSPGTILPRDFSEKDAVKAGMIYLCDETDFSNKNLSGIKFSSYKFSKYGVNNFKDMKFVRSNLHYADFTNGCLENCNFKKATLRNASLKNANCQNANFFMTNLVCADLRGANFQNTNLAGARMQGIKYDEKTDFAAAIYDQNTILPAGFNPIAHKMTYKESAIGKKD